MAIAFFGLKEGYEVNHIDGDGLNNNLSNLEYVTHAENMRHASRTGLMRSGESHPRFKKIKTLCKYCDELAKAQMMCSKHYTRFIRYGSPHIVNKTFHPMPLCKYCDKPRTNKCKRRVCEEHYKTIYYETKFFVDSHKKQEEMKLEHTEIESQVGPR